MDFQHKIIELKDVIRQQLLPIIGEKVILVDAPYYNNIGDVLIWNGIEDFLKNHNINRLPTSSGDTFQFPNLDKDVTILLMGGGNFGDLYPWAQEMRLTIISQYPDNKIIMLPQSVWYDNPELIRRDSELMSRHRNLYLFSRDLWSYEFLSTHFSSNNIRLAPDMAFYIDDKKLEKYRGKEDGNTRLFFRRLDKEVTTSTPDTLPNHELHDWPSIEHLPKMFNYFNKKNYYRVRKLPFASDCILRLVDRLAQRFIRKKLLRMGCNFLAPYSDITTTRLHALILSILLWKPVSYIDNSTFKLSAFSKTWVNNLDSVTKYEG